MPFNRSCLNRAKLFVVFAYTALVSVALCSAQTPGSQQPLGVGGRIPVLLISGSDTFHNWRDTTPLTREFLEQTGRFDVRVVEDANILESKTALMRYRVILFNQQVADSTPLMRENLTAYVRNGGGLVALHWAVDNFHDWPGFADILGRVWREGVSKEEHGQFHVHIEDSDHPITRGLKDFDTSVEEAVHYKLEGTAQIHVLATAKTKSGEDAPVMFTRSFGKGRVFFSPFGHSSTGRKNPGVQAMIIRATEWAGTGDVK